MTQTSFLSDSYTCLRWTSSTWHLGLLTKQTLLHSRHCFLFLCVHNFMTSVHDKNIVMVLSYIYIYKCIDFHLSLIELSREIQKSLKEMEESIPLWISVYIIEWDLCIYFNGDFGEAENHLFSPQGRESAVLQSILLITLGTEWKENKQHQISCRRNEHIRNCFMCTIVSCLAELLISPSSH